MVIITTPNKPYTAPLLWKQEEPTVQQFLEYLKKPVTIDPYTDCFEPQLKIFERFENQYPVAIIDEVLIKDPYRKAIDEVLNQNKASKKSWSQ